MVTTGFSFHIYEELELQVYDKNSAPPNTTPSPNVTNLYTIFDTILTPSVSRAGKVTDAESREVQTGWFVKWNKKTK